MHTRHIYVISDLHLGGAPPGTDVDGQPTIGFQMCPQESRCRLAHFIHHIAAVHPNEDTELVINGDFIDFLAEEPVGAEDNIPDEAFTEAPDAVVKLRRAIQRVDEGAPEGERVFEALRGFVAKKHKLTILLGNHDLELSLPQVRRALIEEITEGCPTRFDYLIDGEAYECGNLLIEHGNRYDGWNAVSYGLLRAYRSCVSRNEPIPFPFPPPPGSRLVSELMNPLKRHFKFIDLLKPENETVIPILAAIDPQTIRSLKALVAFLKRFVESTTLQPAPGSQPTIADTVSEAPLEPLAVEKIKRASVGDPVIRESILRSQEILDEVIKEWEETSLHGGFANPIGAGGMELKGIVHFVNQLSPIPGDIYTKLDRTLQTFRANIRRTFDVRAEAIEYQAAADRLAEKDRIVVFGHTHLAKRIALNGGGLYLNTGTWCPVIELPTGVLNPDIPCQERQQQLRAFVDGLRGNEMGTKPYLNTTFVKATVNDGKAEADLFEWTENGEVRVFDGYHHA